jgi:hypothetical protein
MKIILTKKIQLEKRELNMEEQKGRCICKVIEIFSVRKNKK